MLQIFNPAAALICTAVTPPAPLNLAKLGLQNASNAHTLCRVQESRLETKSSPSTETVLVRSLIIVDPCVFTKSREAADFCGLYKTLQSWTVAF